MPEYTTLAITTEFLESLISREFSEKERRRFLNAVWLLDTNEKHPSLRVHQLQGDKKGRMIGVGLGLGRVAHNLRPRGRTQGVTGVQPPLRRLTR